MGGKGGGGNSEPGWMPIWRAEQEKQAKAKSEADAAALRQTEAAKRAADDAAYQERLAAADKVKSDKAAADKATADADAAAKAEADKLAHTPLGYPISSGGAIAAPGATDNAPGTTLGDGLGGAVLSPPSYWVGGTGKGANTGRTSGAIKTVV